jgi:site-specific recombinase
MYHKKIKEERKEMFKKIKERIEKQKKAIVSALITCSLIAYNTAGVYATSGVSDNLSNASNGAQQEALSWIEAAGGFGIVVGALIWASGNSKMAKTVIFCVAIAYILVKYSQDIWGWFTGIF